MFLYITIQISGQTSYNNIKLKKFIAANFYSISEIYIDSLNNKYSNLIRIQFNKKIIDLPKGQLKALNNDICSDEIKSTLTSLNNKYGYYELIKVFPDKIWGDSLAKNRRTGKMIAIHDRSQAYYIKFSNFIPLSEIIQTLQKNPDIEFAEEPEQIYLLDSPNDPLYPLEGKWAFDGMQSEKAWGISKGRDNCLIGISDVYNNDPNKDLPADMMGKVINSSAQHYWSGHGISVAGLAGVKTNNNLDMSSLGWNSKMVLFGQYETGIYDCIDAGACVINMSWWSSNYQSLRNAIHSALSAEIICVAGAGNRNVLPLPFVCYPAAYNFDDVGQVIAVAGTFLNDSEQPIRETSISGYYNWSPGTDPINDPTNAFIDVSAPCDNIYRYSDDWGIPVYVSAYPGTSFAAPWFQP